MKPCLSLLVLALASATAGAQNAPQYTLDDALTQKEGMTRVDDGLYARIGSNSEAYVAINANGQRALLSKLQDLRNRLPARKTAGAKPTLLDRSIAEISQSLSASTAKREVRGDCSGPGGTNMPSLYARATSGSGVVAEAYAIRSLDFGPGTPTSNDASAETIDLSGTVTSSQGTTTIGGTAATASASAPTSRDACEASAYASVTCPGANQPAIRAFATSWAQQPISQPCL